MKQLVRCGWLAVGVFGMFGFEMYGACGQMPAAPAAARATAAPAAGQQSAPVPASAPLQLHTLAPETQADPFPAPDAKYFTASSPSLATVDGFLTAIWGFDPLRIWRVEAIQSTMAPGVSKVVVFVSERRPGAQVRSVVFFTTPDGNHAIAENAVISFGPKPFAENRAKLEQRADGPARGAASKELLLVEFADLQCPHCKEAQTTMDQIAKDFPKARIVVQSYPLVTKHPFAFQASEYGYCVAQKSNDAYFAYADAVFATQASLTADDGVKTLNAAVTKAGLDPAAVAACAATDATKAKVTASLKLGEELGVSETPMLAINGHLVPLTNTSYETLRSVIVFQAQQDGITNVAPPLAGFDPIR